MNRLLQPIHGLIDNWGAKLFVALFTYIIDLFTNIFQTDVELIVLTILFVMGDLLLGIIKSLSNNVKITSRRLRSTILKSIEYTVFLGGMVGLSNVIGSSNADGWVGTFVLVFADIHYIAFIFVMLTEIQSMVENSRNLDSIWKAIKKRINKESK